eukprot:g689.t1
MNVLIIATILLLSIHTAIGRSTRHHLRANPNGRKHLSPERKFQLLQKTCNVSITEYKNDFSFKSLTDEQKCEICTNVYDCGFCEESSHCLAGVHGGPMNFLNLSQQNCSKWHFAPISCKKKTMDEWVEPVVKDQSEKTEKVELDKEEKKLDKKLNEKNKQKGIVVDPCINFPKLQNTLSDKADHIDNVEIKLKITKSTDKESLTHILKKLTRKQKFIGLLHEDTLKKNPSAEQCFELFDLEPRLEKLLKETNKMFLTPDESKTSVTGPTGGEATATKLADITGTKASNSPDSDTTKQAEEGDDEEELPATGSVTDTGTTGTSGSSTGTNAGSRKIKRDIKDHCFRIDDKSLKGFQGPDIKPGWKLHCAKGWCCMVKRLSDIELLNENSGLNGPSGVEENSSELTALASRTTNRTSSSNAPPIKSSTVGSSTVGSSTVGSSTVGSSTVGSSTVGSSTVGSSTGGSPTGGSSTGGSSTGGSSAAGLANNTENHLVVNTANNKRKPKCNATVKRKTIRGEKCIFPFRLNVGTPDEKWYCDCTMVGESRPWCSIQDKEPFEFDYCAGYPGYDDNPKNAKKKGSIMKRTSKNSSSSSGATGTTTGPSGSSGPSDASGSSSSGPSESSSGSGKAGDEEKKEAVIISEDAKKDAEKNDEDDKKKAEEVANEDFKINDMKKKGDEKVKEEEDKIEKEEEAKVNKELNGNVGDTLGLVNTTKLEDEIKVLDDQFQGHIKQNEGLILRQPVHMSRLSVEDDEHVQPSHFIGGNVAKFVKRQVSRIPRAPRVGKIEKKSMEENAPTISGNNNNNKTEPAQQVRNPDPTIDPQEAVEETRSSTNATMPIINEQGEANNTDSSNNNKTVGENSTVAIEPSKYENWETVPGSGVAAYPVV